MQSAITYRRRRSAVSIATALPLLLTLGCAKFVAPRPHDWSGFLDDYSRLREGGAGEVAFVYRNPAAQWTAYDKVIVEPVTLWRSGRHSLDAIPDADLLRLVSRFEYAVRRRLGAGFQLVDAPAPGTLRLRLAITEARASDPVLDVLTATPEDDARAAGEGPIGSELRRFIDTAAIEGEMRDAATDELLAQGIDRRKPNAPRIETWAQLDRAFDFWADRLCSRLEARTGRR